MTNISIEHLHKSFNETPVLRDINLQIKEGEFVTLFGPSGCGKSTTLRILAGLEPHDRGQVKFDNHLLSDPDQGVNVPPERRNIGMVFQSYAIWPHMSVFDNVAYPLKVKRYHSSADISKKVKKALEMVGLEQYFGRFATQLSGGQQQRVALARALVSEPKVLLLDEPLSNLDAKLREQMRLEIRELHRRIGLTTVYVSHDQSESMSLSDKVVVMNKGVVQQFGTPEEVYNAPCNFFVSNFVGKSNFMMGTVTGKNENGYIVRVQAYGSSYELISSGSYFDFETNEEVIVSVRPEHIRLAAVGGEYRPNQLPFQTRYRLYFGSHFEYTLVLGDAKWEVSLSTAMKFQKDEQVLLELPADKIVLLPAKDENVSEQFAGRFK